MRRRPVPPPAASRRAAHTLPELVVAIGAGSLLLTGLVGSLAIAARSIDPPGPLRELRIASAAVFDLTDAAQHAVFVTSRSDRMVQFALADMTGNGRPDVVRYEWSGVPGDPLLRTVNFGASQTVAANVQEFRLEYGLRTKAETYAGPPVVSGEVLLSKLESGSTSDYQVKSDQTPGQCFAPTLPADAISWDVTKVALQLRRSDSLDGRFALQLRPATSAGLPTSQLLGEKTVDESSLGGTYGWMEYAISGAAGRGPSERLCLVVTSVANPVPCEALYVSGGVSLPGHGLLESSDGTDPWTLTTDKGLQFRVKGTYTTPPAGPLTAARTYLTGLRVTLRTGPAGSSRVVGQTPLPNSPEVLSGYWKTDFDADPRAADLNFDDLGDWTEQAGTLDPARISGGVWRAAAANGVTLRTTPDCEFAAPTTVEVRCRSVAVGTGYGATFRISPNRSGATSGVVFTSVRLQVDGTQVAAVYTKPDAATTRLLCQATGLDAGFVDLRLVLDPTTNTVASWINGVWRSTDPFVRYGAGTPAAATLAADGADAEFDYVGVRVGGG